MIPRGTGGIARFAARYPLVWHVIEAEGAGCDTLYPAETLRRLCGLPSDSANREAFQRLDLPGGALAILRLQLMPDARLGPSLAGAFSGRPDLWRAHIDQHVFFWVAQDRRDRFLRACVRLRARGATGPVVAPVVIAVDTALVLAAHGEAAFFSRINTGSTARRGARTLRDEMTFRPVPLWRGEPAVELAIRAPVPLTHDAGRPGNARSTSPPIRSMRRDSDA
jgi:hypothetical protein